MNKLIIVGAGETAELAFEYFTDDSEYEVVSFAVEGNRLIEETYHGLPVVPLESIPDGYPPRDVSAFVAVSYSGLNRERMRLCSDVRRWGYQLASYVSSKAFLGRHVSIGANAFVMEHCSLQHYARIGEGVTMWSGCQIEHRASVGDYAWLASNVVMSGYSEIGSRTFVGSGAVLMDEVKVADDVVVGAGSLVGEDLSSAGRMYISSNRLFPLDSARYDEFLNS